MADGGKKKSKKKKKKIFHKDLGEFDIRINPLGAMESTLDIDHINKFLDAHVDDRKLRTGDEEE